MVNIPNYTCKDWKNGLKNVSIGNNHEKNWNKISIKNFVNIKLYLNVKTSFIIYLYKKGFLIIKEFYNIKLKKKYCLKFIAYWL